MLFFFFFFDHYIDFILNNVSFERALEVIHPVSLVGGHKEEKKEGGEENNKPQKHLFSKHHLGFQNKKAVEEDRFEGTISCFLNSATLCIFSVIYCENNY